jgi:hypothetical protein
LILDGIDWDCEVKTLFREKNLGCRVAVSSAIDWFFENEEEGIILEDDCLPHPDFFRFCQELLDYYRDDERVMHIGGSNFQLGKKRAEASYYYSSYAHIWGWASWRRAWQYYDVDLNNLDKQVIAEMFHDKSVSSRWLDILTRVKKKSSGFNTWDFQWNYALWAQNGLSIVPNVNLVSNIGFGDGTHDLGSLSAYADLQAVSIGSQITHNLIFEKNDNADTLVFNKFYANPLWRRIRNKLRNLIK